MWKDTGPFHGVFVSGTGPEQTTFKTPLRETFLEVLNDIDAERKAGQAGLDFIRNGNGASILPSKVRPPPEPRRHK